MKSKEATATRTRLLRNVFSISFWCLAVQTLGIIFVYYTFSIGLTFYQKWLMKKFAYPLSVVACHLVLKFVLASLCRWVWECYTGEDRISLTWPHSVNKVAPTGFASALDIGLSNWSFEYITVSLYTMTKSTAIVFILGFALLFRLEKKHWSIIVIVGLISGGLFMFSYHSTQFNLFGFFLVMTASFLSGLRWTLAQLIMQKDTLGLSNPLDMVYHVQPWMILAILPFAVGFEGLPLVSSEKVFRYHELSTLLQTVLWVCAGASLAFLMEISEYMVVTFTSSLTLSIAGIIKDVCTFALAIEYSGDQMGPFNILGLIVCMSGIALHVLLKAIHAHPTQDCSGHDGEEYIELPVLNSSDDDEEEEEDEELVLFSQTDVH